MRAAVQVQPQDRRLGAVLKTKVFLLENEEVRILDLPTLIAAKEATFDEHDGSHLASLYLLADEIGVPHRSLEEVEHYHQQERTRDEHYRD